MASRRTALVFAFAFMAFSSYLDSVRGPLLPLINKALNIDYEGSSWFLVAANFGAVVSTLLLIYLNRHLSFARTVFLACFVCLATVSLSSVIENLVALCFFGALIGMCFTSLGGLSNVLVMEATTSQKRGRMYCGLHMLYGLASQFAPFAVVGLQALPGDFAKWNCAFWISAPVFLIILIYLGFNPLNFASQPQEEVLSTRVHGLVKALALAFFAFYVVGEVLISAWMVPYLTSVHSMTLADAAPYLSGFFLLMALTRALCFLSIPESLETVVLIGSLFLTGCFLSLGIFGGYKSCLALSGVVGPVFPLFMARLTRHFGKDSKAMIFQAIFWMQLVLGIGHALMGKLTAIKGLEFSYLLALFFTLISLACLLLYFKKEKRELSEELP